MSDNYLIFIGSGEASRVERKVLIWSLITNGKIPKDRIRVFNGTHDTLEDADGNALIKLDLDIFWKYQNVTEFSMYRFLIPGLMGYKGYGIWLDSDILCLNHGIDQLLQYHKNNPGFDLACVTNAYAHLEHGLPALSVMNINCATSSFNLGKYKTLVESGMLTYKDINLHNKNFLKHFPTRIGSIPRHFNSFDSISHNTCLVHYTNLRSQPWKYYWHPYGKIWHLSLHKALQNAFVSEGDIELSIARSYIRETIYDGNTPSLSSVIKVGRRVLRYLSNA